MSLRTLSRYPVFLSDLIMSCIADVKTSGLDDLLKVLIISAFTILNMLISCGVVEVHEGLSLSDVQDSGHTVYLTF